MDDFYLRGAWYYWRSWVDYYLIDIKIIVDFKVFLDQFVDKFYIFIDFVNVVIGFKEQFYVVFVEIFGEDLDKV